jgi:hypothetical protein
MRYTMETLVSSNLGLPGTMHQSTVLVDRRPNPSSSWSDDASPRVGRRSCSTWFLPARIPMPWPRAMDLVAEQQNLPRVKCEGTRSAVKSEMKRLRRRATGRVAQWGMQDARCTQLPLEAFSLPTSRYTLPWCRVYKPSHILNALLSRLGWRI